jgi:hypothetical protein
MSFIISEEVCAKVTLDDGTCLQSLPAKASKLTQASAYTGLQLCRQPPI